MKTKKRIKKHLFLGLSILAAFQLNVLKPAHAGPTLDATRARGSLLCSSAGRLHTDPNDYSDAGKIAGFDRDFCRAIAAATLNNESAIQFTQLIPQNRFQALQEGAVDVLIRSTTWTFSRDTSLGVHFAATNFYDGQGFIAPKNLGITKLGQLKSLKKKAIACVEKNTTTRDNVVRYVRDKALPVEIMEFNTFEELRYSFITGKCDLYTADLSYLVEVRLQDVPNPDDYLILDDVISKEPLGAAVRDDDPQWFNIVRWVIFATIQAEELGISSHNVEDLRKNGNLAQMHFLGAERDLGKSLDLSDDWAYQVIKSVGNFGEIFERNLGPKTIYNLDRGLNNLWTKGGLIYAPPFN
ncbi:MAG: amino acid ABC transporter substrate-binding protein [Rhodospirillaceae bacterium]|nr:MAG: amino acid ABC transporter substrate-binding protein [Rhodospirillaceae bacterium]